MKLEHDQLVRIAVRENNTKRPYLLVNPSQGKHMPVAPQEALAVFAQLAQQVQHQVGATDPVLIIAFAETATAIGAAVAAKLQNPTLLIQTTREVAGAQNAGAAIEQEYLCFSESHSHAVEQYLSRKGLDSALQFVKHIVFIEDEVTTGNTILHCIEALLAQYQIHQARFGVASILNGMTAQAKAHYWAQDIWIQYILHTDNEVMASALDQYGCHGAQYAVQTACQQQPQIVPVLGAADLPHRVWQAQQYQRACEALAQVVCQGTPVQDKRILVLGTEECMYPGLWAGYSLQQRGHQVRFHATTRSPILPSAEPDYPLQSRYTLQSLYDSTRTTYLYNLAPYDRVCIVTDAPNPQENGLISLTAALEQAGNLHMTVFHWRQYRGGHDE